MNILHALLPALLLPSISFAETVLVDFNDSDANGGSGSPVSGAVVDGGIAVDGASIINGYDAVTSLVDFRTGDLSVSTTGYAAAQGPVLFDGPWHVAFNDTQGRGRFQHLDLADYPIGTTWVSFMVNIDPDGDSDGEGPAFAGITFGNGAFNSNTNAIPSSAAGSFLGMTYIPTGFTGAGTYLEFSNAGIPDLDGLTDTGTQVNQGTRSADLGLSANTTYLVIAELNEGTDTIRAWINPSDVSSELSLGTPDLTTALGITHITRLGFGGDADEDGNTIYEHVECKIDAIRTSNTPAAFQWITTNNEPHLIVDPGTADTNYNFGTILGGSASRTVSFANLSQATAQTITIDSVTVTNSAGGVFTTGSLPSLPLVLNDGDSIDIEVIANGGATGSFVGEITIDTTSSGSLGADANDTVLPLDVEFFNVPPAVLGSADINGNGLPDLAELRYPGISGLPPGTDSDGDGATDAQEASAGTNPFDPSSFLRSLNLIESPTIADTFEFTFASEIGTVYAISATEDLSSWSQIGSSVLATAPETTVLLAEADLPSPDQTFIRAGTLAPLDTDADGLEDNLELFLGYDPTVANSVRSASDNGDLGQFIDLMLGGSPTGGLFGSATAGVPSEAQASRFLAQATFGPTENKISALRSLGPDCYETWIDQQLATPPNYLRTYIDILVSRMASDSSAPDYTVFPHYVTSQTSFAMFRENVNSVWMRQAMFADDELRQRMAWALSQIVVIGPRCNSYGIAAADWYDKVLEHSLGNYRDLLYDISVHPWMGWYLSHVGNKKADPTINLLPDENFAREIMQLFSIGLVQLNMDGTPVLDINGDTIPTYTNEDIAQMARVFTGLNLQAGSGQGVYALFPMQMVEADHDSGEDPVSTDVYGAPEKLLLGSSLPAFVDDPGRTGLDDVNDAVDILINHPSCPPFISKNLIQHLVTSNPSPAYVERVANVFADDGTGTRGNLAATVKAILLDPEARNLSASLNPTAGRLKGPMLRLTMMARAFNAGASTPALHDLTGIQFWKPGKTTIFSDFLEFPNEAPSVFNFYEPGYSRPGEVRDLNLLSPEFEIMNPLTATTTPNRLWTFMQDGLHTGNSSVTPEFKLQLGPLQTTSLDTDALLDHINLYLCHGSLSAEGRADMKSFIDFYAATSPNSVDRTELAIYLALVSPYSAVLD